MKRIKGEDEEFFEDVPENPEVDENRPRKPRPDTGEDPASDRMENVLEARFRWGEALNYWQIGNQEAMAKNYGTAEFAYEESQKAVVRYFEKFYTTPQRPFSHAPSASTAEKIKTVVSELFMIRLVPEIQQNPFYWLVRKVRRRREAITLQELQKLDWSGFSLSAEAVLKTPREIEDQAQTMFRQESLDYFALILATVFVPLARAEMNRDRRNFDAAIAEYQRLLTPYRVFSYAHSPIWLTCDFIERPFILQALGEARLAKAELQFRAASQSNMDRAAAQATYQSIRELFKDQGGYVDSITNAKNKLADDADQLSDLPLNQKDIALQVFGKDVTVPGIKSRTKELPGLSQTKAPSESWLQFQETANGDTNPRVYVLLLNTQARLLQLEHGFNYLGYKDNYVPPWRFQFLLERARYFSEHAKNAQRDYLNFLNNAQHEELQEQSAAQVVDMEKANVRIESARQTQVNAEYQAAIMSKALAQLTATNAGKRLKAYKTFDASADKYAREALRGSKISALGGALSGALSGNPIAGGFAGLISGWGQVKQEGAQLRTADAQRDFEKANLRLAEGEAKKAIELATAQAQVASQAMVVSSLQKQAALLRHEFAIQNLQYLHKRTLNAEQWLRLANAIRGVADTYLRYAIELAFLSEQAYEFEADKRINVIRFDYDQSEVGAYLAADFLLKDLDTVEQDFIVNQRQRQQQVRYVLSLAREFPAALEELREVGKVDFILRVEQIEKRFPGLYNVRVGMVDVLPMALIDSTRFSIDLTHVGNSQMRIKGEPDVPVGEQSESILNVSDLPAADYDWTKTPQALWPVKILVNEPETAVFSGLSRQDAAAAFATTSSGQLNAFEGRGLAGGWVVDMSSRDNQVVPESLADLLITFTASGYYDSGLRAAIEAAKPQTTSLTSYFSARNTFPDSFFDFNRTARMVWNVPREMLALNGDLGRLRNIGMSLRPGASNVHFGRLMTRLRVNFRIDETNGIASGFTLFTHVPEVSVTQTAPLTVTVRAALDTATELSWDFGDGTPVLHTVRSGTPPQIAPADHTHTYAKPGRYVIKLRCVHDKSLSEFRINVVVSRNQKLGDPLIIFLPPATFDTTAKTITFTAAGNVQQAGRMLWRVGDESAEGDSVTFTPKPGNYMLDFAAMRKLSFRTYGAQRYLKDMAPLSLHGLDATTNRMFDRDGNETNGTGTPPLAARNDLAERIFGNGAISPEDDWTFELIPQEIMGLPVETLIGTEELDLSEIEDVVLSMEYDITPGSLQP